METEEYVYRQSPAVRAVRITEENMAAVSHWCCSPIRKNGEDAEFIRIKEVRGYVGSWVVKTPNGFRVYKDKKFHEVFSPGSETWVAVLVQDAKDKFESYKKTDFFEDFDPERNRIALPQDAGLG